MPVLGGPSYIYYNTHMTHILHTTIIGFNNNFIRSAPITYDFAHIVPCSTNGFVVKINLQCILVNGV